MKVDFRSKNGFTTIDLSIAMIIMLIFIVIMTSVSYNAYLSSMEAKRTAVALNYAVAIFEKIGNTSFQEVKASENLLSIQGLDKFTYDAEKSTVNQIVGKIGTYDISLGIEDYRGSHVIKIIDLNITYSVSRKQQKEKIELKRLKILEGVEINQEENS